MQKLGRSGIVKVLVFEPTLRIGSFSSDKCVRKIPGQKAQ